jgi:hypothetical protein
MALVSDKLRYFNNPNIICGLVKSVEDYLFAFNALVIHGHIDEAKAFYIEHMEKNTDLLKTRSSHEEEFTMDDGTTQKLSFSETPLTNAIKAGSLEMVQFLIEKGADVNVKNARGETALNLCCRDGQKDILEKYGAKKQQKKFHTQKYNKEKDFLNQIKDPGNEINDVDHFINQHKSNLGAIDKMGRTALIPFPLNNFSLESLIIPSYND